MAEFWLRQIGPAPLASEDGVGQWPSSPVGPIRLGNRSRLAGVGVLPTAQQARKGGVLHEYAGHRPIGWRC